MRQSLVPDLRGRVGGADRFVVSCAAPLGAVLGGIAGQTLGLRETFAVAGGLGLVIAILFLDKVNNRAVVRAGQQVQGQSRLSLLS